MLYCLLPLAMLLAAGYLLARSLGLPWRTRLLTAAALGLTGGPALAWLVGVLVPAVRPDLPLLGLGLAGAACAVRDLRKTPPNSLRPDRGLLLVLAAALAVTAYQCSVVVGTHWEHGNLVIANLHAHDAFWHLAIAAMLRPGAEFASPWPPPNPVWADVRLTNYHPLTDVLVALLAPHEGQLSAYFHVLPPLYCLVFAGATAWVARLWGATYGQAAFTVLLTGLCGSLGHLVALTGSGPEIWDSAFWLSQPWSMCNNPPLSLSYGALMVGLALLSLPKAPLAARAAALGILWGASFGVKAYLPALVIPALALAALLAPAPERKSLAVIFAAVAAGAGALLLLTTQEAAGLMVYDPGWLLSTIIGQGDRVGLLAGRTLRGVTQDMRPLVVFAWFGAALPLYVFGNLGVRVAGLRRAWRVFTGREEAEPGTTTAQRTALGVCALGLLVPLLFKQKGVEWNTIQFGYYPLGLLPLWAGPRVLDWINARPAPAMRALRVAGVALLALPTTLQRLADPPTGSIIPASELAALRELNRTVPVGGIIAVQPGQVAGRPMPQSHGFYKSPDPTGSAYVAALTARPTYFADPLTLQILLLPGKERGQEVVAGLALPEPQRKQWLSDRGIQGVYTVPRD